MRRFRGKYASARIMEIMMQARSHAMGKPGFTGPHALPNRHEKHGQRQLSDTCLGQRAAGDVSEQQGRRGNGVSLLPQPYQTGCYPG
ncbi:hypothetical protein COO20_01970 [Thalassospira marina]|uniref:Uncharacterized protein n=1 Tax=Thalassospira marina TaxID=2048283 RepID=A0A2N3KZK2_9PROT|nr:hypothetical protein COO20_01970 [Thalassospira marina]